MKKKSILGRVGIVAAALTLATTSLMSGTLARYQTKADMKAKAIAAQWAATVKGAATGTDEGKFTEVETIDFAETILATSDVKAATIGDSTGAKRIAPGTKGSYELMIDLTGTEVPALFTMTVKQSADNSLKLPTNLTVKIMDGKTVIASFSKNDITASGKTVVGGTTPAVRFASAVECKDSSTYTQKKTYTITWDWPLKDGDASDDDDAQEAYNSNDKLDAGSTFGFDISYTITQHDGTGIEGTTYKTALKTDGSGT